LEILMGDMGDVWKEVNQYRKEKRELNRQNSADILKEKGIHFERKNMGAHLIINHNNKIVDFWPGTGKWIIRKTNKKGRGIFNLLKVL